MISKAKLMLSRAVSTGGARGAVAPPMILKSRYCKVKILLMTVKIGVLAPPIILIMAAGPSNNSDLGTAL